MAEEHLHLMSLRSFFFQAEDGIRYLTVNVVQSCFFFFQAEDGIRDLTVTGVQPCALPIFPARRVAASQALRAVPLGAAAASVLLGCGTPGVRGVAGTAPAPNVLWTPPRQPAAAPAAAPPELPADLAGRIAELKLTDVIDIALRNNTATSAAWADARSAAASYGAAKGQIYPTVALNGSVQAIKRIASGGVGAAKQQSYGPSVTGSGLPPDFGGRSG